MPNPAPPSLDAYSAPIPISAVPVIAVSISTNIRLMKELVIVKAASISIEINASHVATHILPALPVLLMAIFAPYVKKVIS